jgi:hypothetical protein
MTPWFGTQLTLTENVVPLEPFPEDVMQILRIYRRALKLAYNTKAAHVTSEREINEKKS